ncbi:5-formyltetrahydrofolate cyclo-ligase [Lucifera butyrica]|nr:5-formyltetrahydrofolate cyclo-ligase [Lucifera butyrica]
MPDFKQTKAQLRQELLKVRRSLESKDIERYSQLMGRHLFSWLDYQQANRVMIYLSTPDEPGTDDMIRHALQHGKTVCVPMMRAEYGLMDSAIIHDLADLQPGRLGIRSPKPERTTILAPAKIDLAIIPGVAFDIAGGRLGMGAGYYDRFLSLAGQAVFLGMAWRFQIKPTLPQDTHDVKMHYLLTEDGILTCRGGKM